MSECKTCPLSPVWCVFFGTPAGSCGVWAIGIAPIPRVVWCMELLLTLRSLCPPPLFWASSPQDVTKYVTENRLYGWLKSSGGSRSSQAKSRWQVEIGRLIWERRQLKKQWEWADDKQREGISALQAEVKSRLVTLRQKKEQTRIEIFLGYSVML